MRVASNFDPGTRELHERSPGRAARTCAISIALSEAIPAPYFDVVGQEPEVPRQKRGAAFRGFVAKEREQSVLPRCMRFCGRWKFLGGGEVNGAAKKRFYLRHPPLHGSARMDSVRPLGAVQKIS